MRCAQKSQQFLSCLQTTKSQVLSQFKSTQDRDLIQHHALPFWGLFSSTSRTREIVPKGTCNWISLFFSSAQSERNVASQCFSQLLIQQIILLCRPAAHFTDLSFSVIRAVELCDSFPSRILEIIFWMKNSSLAIHFCFPARP
jgi:hypothetical protein